MTITAADLDTKYAAWFIGMKNTKHAKREILGLFSTEPDDEHVWSEQDIYEQSRKIIIRWNDSKVHLDGSVLKCR
ncbi:MAG: hypothetical protein IKI93_02130 [Clostridia bacterium]|nr:hypothetical protein [Clostridia bacterium]